MRRCWSVDETTGIAETKSVVSPGVTYQYPLNPAVSVTFNCLPADESLWTSLKIEQVQMSELNLPDTVNHRYWVCLRYHHRHAWRFLYLRRILAQSKRSRCPRSHIEKSIDEAKQEVQNWWGQNREESDSVKNWSTIRAEAVTVIRNGSLYNFVVVPTDLVSK